MDKVKIYSIFYGIISSLVIAILAYFLFKRPVFDCTGCEGKVTTYIDTIYSIAPLTPITVKVPKPTKINPSPRGIINAKDFHAGLSTSVQDGNIPALALPALEPCGPWDSLYYYSDTIHQANDYHIVINDTTQGPIMGRSVWFTNLRPSIVSHDKVYLKERWKVYAGMVVTGQKGRWGMGPAAVLTAPKIGAISYSYDARNNAHIAGVYVLLRFKRD